MPELSPAGEPVAPPAVQSVPSDAGAVPDPRANWAFILGIASLALSFASCLPIFSLVSCLGPVAAIAAIILGAMVKRDVEARGGLEQDRKRAHQGLVMGIVGLALYLVLIVGGILFSFVVSLLGEW
jgi:hypothetical protein